ncbi:MAG: hypothetical protein OES38_07645 [Gammaproteobacteria bacterium]|nr:hypothetical protein [Gammaproteobacteria bacterium]
MSSNTANERDWADAASRYASVGAMTPQLVHDLNNLLSIANGYIELTEIEQGPGSEHLGEIKTAVTQMTSLLRSMRTLMQGNPEQNPVELIEEWRPALELALGKKVRLELDAGQFHGIPMPNQHSLQSMLVCACLLAPHLLPAGGAVRFQTAQIERGWIIDTAYLSTAGLACVPPNPLHDWWERALEFAEASGVTLRLQSIPNEQSADEHKDDAPHDRETNLRPHGP